MYTHIIVHYGEIGLKGDNRPFFERKLIDNIKHTLSNVAYRSIKRISGRILIELLDQSDNDALTKGLNHVFGISYFCFVVNTTHNIEDIQKTAVDLVTGREKTTVYVTTKRSNKQFPLTSPDLNRTIGKYIAEKTEHTIDYVNAELILYMEIVEKYCFMYTEKIEGLKGLPVGVSGKVVSLISGGIDSPVAAYLAMKRGCAVKFVHFYNETINTKESIEKIKQLVDILATYNINTTLYLIPFKDIQFEIMKTVPRKYRMLLYKRFMYTIGARIARKEKALAVVTGDNIAQVSSQVIPNLKVIWDASDLLVISPLLTYDKQEIVNLGEKIGTYEVSIQPYEDCCSYMIARHPELNADKDIIDKLETRIDIEELIFKAVKSAIKSNA